jgi:hypothetical protein
MSTADSKIQFKDGPHLDAFARLRVSEPANQFDSQMQYDLQPLLWETVTSGSGTVTHLPNEGAARLRCSGANNDVVIRQTYRYMRYRPGKSQMILMTGVMGAKKAGVIQRIGYFDNDNGLFFEQDQNNLKVVTRTKTSGAVVDHAVTQDTWNLDKLDGTGPSTISIDMAKANIFFMDFEWLGVGRVRFGFVINGIPVYCHEVLNANNTEHVYMTTANLPCRYEIRNVAATTQTDMLQICTTVMSEGGEAITSGILRGVGNGTSTITVSTRRAILSIRPKLLFASAANRSLIIPENFSLYVDGTTDVYWEIVRGGTLGGTPVWNSVGDNSAVEFDVAGTTVAGGEVLATGYAAGGGGTGGGANGVGGTASLNLAQFGLTSLPLHLNYAANSSTVLSLVVTAIAGGSAPSAGSFTWAEIR